MATELSGSVESCQTRRELIDLSPRNAPDGQLAKRRNRARSAVKGADDSFIPIAPCAIIDPAPAAKEWPATLTGRTMGEKGNMVDPGLAVVAAGPSVIERTSSVVSSTVVQSADTLRGKVIGAGVDVAVGEVRDRVKERRDAAEHAPQDKADPELPPPSAPSSPS